MSEETLTEKRRWLHNQLNGAIAFIALALVFVVLRCIVRGAFRRSRGSSGRGSSSEDLLIFASLIAFLPLCACAIVDAQAYLAVYSDNGSTQDVVTLYKASYGLSVVYPIACVLPKIAVCCMYLDFFGVDTPTRRIAYATITFSFINAIAWFVPSVAVCQPISAYWYQELDKCINFDLFGVWISLPHIVTDLIILYLPLPILWGTRLKRSKKLGLTITFLAGSVGIVGACLRLALYIHRYYVARPGSSQTTRSIAGSTIVSYVEPGMYLVAACLPRLQPLMMRMHASFTDSFSSLMGRRYRSDVAWPSASLNHKKQSSEHRRLVPRVEIALTGQGNLRSLAREYEEL